jgi:hypothetical protein
MSEAGSGSPLEPSKRRRVEPDASTPVSAGGRKEAARSGAPGVAGASSHFDERGLSQASSVTGVHVSLS